MNPFSLEGKRILVTGASSGIGREVAVVSSQSGASVVLSGRDEARLADTLGRLGAGDHHVFQHDLSRVDTLQQAMLDVVASCGRIDGVVHCAGRQLTRPIRSTSVDAWSDLLKINLDAAFALIKAVRQKQVRGEHCSIVLMSSVMGQVGQPGLVAYCASKSGLEGLTRAAALELARAQIRVNAIAPGHVETEMAQEKAAVLTSEQRDAIAAAHPLGPGRAGDVANAAVFLLSDAARWITGTTLVVDGGFSAQ